MSERWFPSGLDVRFPPLQAASYYQLLHVGRVRHIPSSPLDQEVLVYFQGGSGSDGEPISPGLVTQPVNMQRATLLIPGSRWSAGGQLLSDSSHTYPAHRTVPLGIHIPCLRRLSQVLPAGTVLPPALHTTLRDAWYAVVDVQTERLLIPCFELLRAFYYQAGGKLVDYFFSRLPLETVCWPIMAPTLATNFTAHFCVAAQLGRSHEARVLAELLFNTSYRTTIQRTHAELAVTWNEHATRGLVSEAHFKVLFHLGKTVLAKAHGTAFTVGKQAFFWVSSLIPPADWFSFRSVVYHPLQHLPKGHNRPFTPLPAFTDVLSQRWPTRVVPTLTKSHGDSNPFVGAIQLSTTSRSNGPPVVRAFPWAELVPHSLPPAYANTGAAEFLWARPGHYPSGTKARLPDLPIFRQLLRGCRKLGCSVHRLEVNNPNRRFGSGRSVFPYACAPTPYTHLPDRRPRPLGIAHIGWGGGNFYIFYILDYNYIVLAFRDALTEWTRNECNELLFHAAQADLNWFHARELLSKSSQHSLVVRVYRNDSMQLLAAHCHWQMQSAIRDCNIMADYSAQINELGIDLTVPLTASLTERLQALYRAASEKKYEGKYLGEAPLS